MAHNDRPDNTQQWTYFYDFIENLRSRSESQWKHVITEIQYLRLSTPRYPELIDIGFGIYRFYIEISDNETVIIEFEYDRNDKLEPVMGGIAKV